MKKMIKRILLILKFHRKVIFGKKATATLTTNFEGCNKIDDGSKFQGTMGYGSYIAKNSSISGKIGRFCSIGSHVRVIVGMHPVDFVSTHPMFYSKLKQNGHAFVDEQKYDDFRYSLGNYCVVIGNDVWIGDSVSIMSGVTIGDGAIVGTGAVVTKDVEPYSIVGGVPAKVIKYRFDSDTIEKFIDISWWEWELEAIKEKANEFSNIEKFLSKYWYAKDGEKNP